MRTRAALTVFLCIHVRSMLGGPPFQTDDPVPTKLHYFELYAFGLLGRAPAATVLLAPASEFNWGAAPNLELHVLAFGATLFSGGRSASGLGDIEAGVKYRFLTETKYRPQVAVTPNLEFPTGNQARGLGNGQLWASLSVWAQKSFGLWTTYGGGGVVVNRAQGRRTFPFGGWVLQRKINNKLTLGGEAFAHGGMERLFMNSRRSVLLDFGGFYNFNPGFSLLFAGGHSVAGQSETYAYLGLYWTWSPKGRPSRPGSPHPLHAVPEPPP